MYVHLNAVRIKHCSMIAILPLPLLTAFTLRTGEWGIGVAARTTDLSKIPLGDDAVSWVCI